MSEKSTEELFGEIKGHGSVEEYLAANEEQLRECSLEEYLAALLAAKDLVKSEVIHASGLETKSAYHIFSGHTRRPGREKLLALALAMRLTLKETQHLLHYGGSPMLYPRESWDSVVIYAIEHGLSVIEANILLHGLAEDARLLE